MRLTNLLLEAGGLREVSCRHRSGGGKTSKMNLSRDQNSIGAQICRGFLL